MVQIIQEKRPQGFADRIMSGLAEVAPGIAAGHQEAQLAKQKSLAENDALSKITGMNLTGITDPKLKKIAFSEALKGKSQGQLADQKAKQNKAIIDDLEEKRGLPKGSLAAYVNNPKMAETVSRPQKDIKKTQASQPIDPDQLKLIKSIRNTPEFKEADPLTKYQMMTDAGISKENASEEADIAAKQSDLSQKSFESNYKANEDFFLPTLDYLSCGYAR